MKGGAVDEIQSLKREVFQLEQWRHDMLQRVDRMRITMEELRRSKFTVSAILMRYPSLDYQMQITHTYQTPSGQVIIIEPLPFKTSCSDARPQGQEDPGERTHPKAPVQIGTECVSVADKQPIATSLSEAGESK